MFLAVKSGQATAMQMDSPVIDWYAANNGDLKTLPENLGNIQGNAIFMKPGDFTFWLWLDTVVQELTVGSRYNEYTDVYKKWFGRNPPAPRFSAAGAVPAALQMPCRRTLARGARVGLWRTAASASSVLVVPCRSRSL
jgi:hypothetical protein